MMEIRAMVVNLLRLFEREFAGDLREAVMKTSRDAFMLNVGILERQAYA